MTPAIVEVDILTGIKDTIETKLEAFVEAIEDSELLELDGVLYKDTVHEGRKIAEDGLKILHRKKRLAYHVPVKVIMEYTISELIEAIETGVFDKVYGITRIVGYYSRISNWNLSKKGELKDRHKGNYSVKQVC